MPRPAKIPAVRFNLKSHDKKADLTPILIVLIFRYNGKRLVYSTGEKVKPRYWNSGKAKPNIKNHSHYGALNHRLQELEQHTINIFIENDFGKISLADFKTELAYRNGDKDRPSEEIPTLLQFIESYIDDKRGKVATVKSLVTCFNLLKQYSGDKGYQLNYEDIDWQFRNDFLEWVYAPPRSHSIATAYKNVKILKQFMNAALKEKYHNNQVYIQSGYNVTRPKVKNKVRLTFEEVRQLNKLDLSDNPRLDKVRDLFIVGCYTGLRFSDWYKVKKENIEKKGLADRLSIVTQKTKTSVIIPLLPELKAVLEKYDYKLPKISSQKFNKYIKEVCQMVLADKQFKRIYTEGGKVKDEIIEKWTRVSSHCARRSFATNFLELGMKPVTLMQITGHATEKQFFEYIDVDQEHLAQRFASEYEMIVEAQKLKVVK